MKKITTKDGSVSYHNKQYDETYHSTSGALEESFEKFAKPCELKSGMHVLDICFGLGYNSLAALCIAPLHIVGLENDPLILEKIESNEILENEKSFEAKYEEKTITGSQLQKNYEKVRQAAKLKDYADNETSIKIILGDARTSIKNLDLKFDAAFLDPFSPKKCPELWSEEFFKDVARVMKKGGILTSYSCASSVRKNLMAAGFLVKDGPCVGRRSPSTIAMRQ